MKQESTNTAAKKVDNRKIRNTVYNAYCEGGQSAAFALADSYGVKYEYCKACECESPQIKHTCLICGQETTPAAPTIVDGKQGDVEGFTPGEWEAKQITSTQIIIGIKGYGEGDNYRKDNRCGQIAIIKGWNGDSTAPLSEEDKANAALIASAPKLKQKYNKALELLDNASQLYHEQAKNVSELKEQVKILREAIEFYRNGVGHFYKKINFGSSFLDAEAIQFMNNHPIKFTEALNQTK